MDTSPHTSRPRRRSRTPAEGDRPVTDPGTRGRRSPACRSANDAVWWVVLYQGALDYAQSIGDADRDADAATRLVDSYQVARRP